MWDVFHKTTEHQILHTSFSSIKTFLLMSFVFILGYVRLIWGMILQPRMALTSGGGLDENVSHRLMYANTWFPTEALFGNVQEAEAGWSTLETYRQVRDRNQKGCPVSCEFWISGQCLLPSALLHGFQVGLFWFCVFVFNSRVVHFSFWSLRSFNWQKLHSS